MTKHKNIIKDRQERMFLTVFFLFFLFSAAQISFPPAGIYAQRTSTRKAELSTAQKIIPNGAPTIDLTASLRSCWQSESKKATNVKFASDNKIGLYVASNSSVVEYLDARDGRRFWISELGGTLVSNLAAGEKSVFLAVKINGARYLRSVAENTGLTNWQMLLDSTADGNTIGGGDGARSVDGDRKNDVRSAENAENVENADDFEINLYAGDSRVIAAFAGGDFLAADEEKGVLLWRVTAGGGLRVRESQIADKILVATVDNRLYGISKADGHSFINLKTTYAVTALAYTANGGILIGEKNGSVASLNPSNNAKLWQTRVGGAQISDITVTPGGLLVSSYDNFVYFLSANGGRRIWKRRLPGRIAGKPTIYGASAVINTSYGRTATIVELKKGAVVNKITLEEENFFDAASVIFTDRRIIFGTRLGLRAFADPNGGC